MALPSTIPPKITQQLGDWGTGDRGGQVTEVHTAFTTCVWDDFLTLSQDGKQVKNDSLVNLRITGIEV